MMGKDVQFAFRVEASLREQFVRACKEIDRPAGQVLREFMREFVRERVQPSLFDGLTSGPVESMVHQPQGKYELNR